MNRDATFWISLGLFQVVFGLAVFTLTRQYYIHEPEAVSAGAAARGQAATARPDPGTTADLETFLSSSAGQAALEDPTATSRIADQFFANRQYDKAAEMYQRVLASDPKSADTYNSLGLTLQYLGRSDEALRILNEGIKVDSGYQRIWLTLGFVNSQVGNIEQARKALNTAVQMGADNEIGKSAEEMLKKLP